MMSVHVRVSGRVQGVYYRAYTRDRAKSLGINGWVRNIPGGGVEAVLEGERRQVGEMPGSVIMIGCWIFVNNV